MFTDGGTRNILERRCTLTSPLLAPILEDMISPAYAAENRTENNNYSFIIAASRIICAIYIKGKCTAFIGKRNVIHSKSRFPSTISRDRVTSRYAPLSSFYFDVVMSCHVDRPRADLIASPARNRRCRSITIDESSASRISS